MEFKKSVFKLIKSRKSERTFEYREMSKEELDEIIHYINSIKGPFKGSVRIELIVDKKGIDMSDDKLGTYGIIKDAKYYLACVIKRDEDSLYQLGYVLEKAVLYLWNMGLGTCWMGGTFKRSKFAEQASVKEGEYLPIVIPFGYPKQKRSITDKIVRLAAKSEKRKPWGELFYENTLETPLLPEMSAEYKTAIESVRLAPSASNKQPWRLIKKGEDIEFYLKITPGYNDKIKFNIQEVDLGIAMAHFELVLVENEKKGKWNIVLEKDDKKDMVHVATWKAI